MTHDRSVALHGMAERRRCAFAAAGANVPIAKLSIYNVLGNAMILMGGCLYVHSWHFSPTVMPHQIH